MLDNNRNVTKGAHIIKKYYSGINKNIIKCQLCPHNCLIPESKTGICSTRKNVKGKFISLVYGRPCAIQIDPIEKKPLYHFYPGKKIFSLGTFGCNMKCKGCQNFDISQTKIEKNTAILEKYTPQDIINAAAGCNMIAYTYNEPTIFFEYMIDIAKLARKKGYKNVMVSNGYINPEPLNELLKYIDAANIDLKGFNEKFYTEYSGAKLKAVMETINIISKSKTWLEVTNLVIPSLNDKYQDIENMCKWIKKQEDFAKRRIPLHFSRFYPHYKALDIGITPEKMLIGAKEIALNQGLKYVYIGNLGYQDNTYCDCGNLLIERGTNMRYANADGIINNRCAKCNNFIDGVF